jgi:hypothetical protein
MVSKFGPTPKPGSDNAEQSNGHHRATSQGGGARANAWESPWPAPVDSIDRIPSS